MKIAEKQNIIFQWFFWQFFEMPKNILKAWRNFLLFNLNYFSIALLLKTFFSPWRKYKLGYPRGFRFSKYLEVFFSNLISRVLGALVRIVLIIAGLLAQVFIIFAGAIIFFGWIVLPFLLVAGFLFGIRLIA
ncbi:MAG: hypothetical protein KYQ20_02075 [Candidatus Nealsonbacteria bacterium]|nr:hypothetical protein [Candidatus Nealsonbacteria bacterium]